MSVYKRIENQLKVSNETLFVALNLCKQKVLTSRETNRLLWSERLEQIRNLIITRNMSCVYKCLSKVRRSQDEEAFSEAMYGVFLAMRCYDVDRGFKYTTYLMNVVKRRLYRYISRITEHKIISTEHVDANKIVTRDVYNSDILSVRELLERNVACLNARELDIIHQSFWDNKPLHAVGDTHNISAERVRMIQENALEKLRLVMAEDNLSLEQLDEKLDLLELKEVA